ncbi:MAG: LytTR family DNA-binding domain-containing protein [Hespellia sp.]|nr:LytTR family DNA-binding domain-containing protein [Hespellia sp.]
MKITICCEDEKLMQKLKKQVEDYFFPIRRIYLVTLTREEMKQELQKKSYFCDLLIIPITAKESASVMKLIREVKANFPTYQLICIGREHSENNYYPELFELNLLYYIYEDKLESLLPRALRLTSGRLEFIVERCLVCKSNHQILKIPFDDITYIEREMHTTKVHTKDSCYYIRSKLNELEDVLAKYPALIRCHMSFFVNCNYAVSFGNKKFELKSGEIIPISRKYYQSVKEYVMHSNTLD